MGGGGGTKTVVVFRGVRRSGATSDRRVVPRIDSRARAGQAAAAGPSYIARRGGREQRRPLARRSRSSVTSARVPRRRRRRRAVSRPIVINVVFLRSGCCRRSYIIIMCVLRVCVLRVRGPSARARARARSDTALPLFAPSDRSSSSTVPLSRLPRSRSFCVFVVNYTEPYPAWFLYIFFLFSFPHRSPRTSHCRRSVVFPLFYIRYSDV